VEYVVIRNRLKWPLRAGYFTDDQYFRSQSGEPPQFRGFSLGTGLIVGPLLVDFAYVHERGSYVDFGGLSNSVSSDRFYASVIYRHPRRP
jgi:hypothetical protein